MRPGNNYMSDGLLNISERVTLAYHALGIIAACNGDLVPVGRIAQAMPVSALYLAKVLQPLARKRIVVSKRGPTGGYALLKNPEDISLYDLVLFYEGALPKGGCLFAHRFCTGNDCAFQELNADVRAKMEEELRKITVKRIGKNLSRRGGKPGYHNIT